MIWFYSVSHQKGSALSLLVFCFQDMATEELISVIPTREWHYHQYGLYVGMAHEIITYFPPTES